MDYLLRNIDPGLWAKGKAWALEHDMSMRDVLLMFLTGLVGSDEEEDEAPNTDE